MIVSEDREVLLKTAMILRPTIKAKTGMVRCGLTEKMRPIATPVKAE